MAGDAGGSWVGYYSWSSEREPRPLLSAACELMGAGAGRVAVDLGCGAGIEVLALLSRGWSVVAIDSEPAGLELLRAGIPAGGAGQVQIVCESFAAAELPRAHLVHAGFSLPFCRPGEFPGVWARVRRSLLPGGIFAGQLFGMRDSWAADPAMVFHDMDEVQGLLAGLELLELSEVERDGVAFTGPKHWHIFDILAREPAVPSA